MANKIGVYVDANGLYVGDVLDDTPQDTNLTFVSSFPPEGLHLPMRNGTQWVEGKSASDLLQIAQNIKLAELDNKYAQAVAFIKSNALNGVSHTYVIRNGDTDYSSFFNAKFSYVQSSYYDGTSFNWYTVEEGDVSHTKDQFCQAYADIERYTESARSQRKQYATQIQACTTPDAVNNITITFS